MYDLLARLCILRPNFDDMTSEVFMSQLSRRWRCLGVFSVTLPMYFEVEFWWCDNWQLRCLCRNIVDDWQHSLGGFLITHFYVIYSVAIQVSLLLVARWSILCPKCIGWENQNHGFKMGDKYCKRSKISGLKVYLS
jgi:hypothetical protein